jgi:hypothetical protein
MRRIWRLKKVVRVLLAEKGINLSPPPDNRRQDLCEKKGSGYSAQTQIPAACFSTNAGLAARRTQAHASHVERTSLLTASSVKGLAGGLGLELCRRG